MKKWISVVIMFAMIGMMQLPVFASDAGPMGPAPNAGDGVSDGSGFESPNGPIGETGNEGSGPAPNSGDGIPDGSGMDCPNEPSC